MKTVYSLIFMIIFSLYSCNKDEKSDSLSRTPPKTPTAVNYDLNNDAMDDIKIEYRWFTWDGINNSGDLISGLIKPLNSSSILQKHNESYLFNTINDTIKSSLDDPYYWEDFSEPHIVTISTSIENPYWTDTWKVNSNLTMDYYYLGIKIPKNSHNLLGWIKLKINKSNGGIQIVDKKFTTEDFIVIGKITSNTAYK